MEERTNARTQKAISEINDYITTSLPEEIRNEAKETAQNLFAETKIVKNKKTGKERTARKYSANQIIKMLQTEYENNQTINDYWEQDFAEKNKKANKKKKVNKQ